MDIMKDFEGIKRINNTLNLTINQLYELLLKYQEQIGKLVLEEDKVICDTDGKYCVHVYCQNNQIVLERKTDDGTEEEHQLGEDIKNVHMSIADRMVEQIYDFLMDYLDGDGVIKEEITGVKKILFSYQEEKNFSDIFYIKGLDDRNVYEVKKSKFFDEYTIENLELRRKDVKISFKNSIYDEFKISKNPYTIIDITVNKEGIKTKFVGKLNSKELLVTSDYTENHFIVELDKVVIGAIDSLDKENKNKYRLEINQLEYEYLIIALNVIIDIYLEQKPLMEKE